MQEVNVNDHLTKVHSYWWKCHKWPGALVN